MGIPSLNSAILYNISLYFHSNYADITNIPDLIHENEHFHGWEMKFGVGTFMHHVLFNELIYLSLIMISSWNFIC